MWGRNQGNRSTNNKMILGWCGSGVKMGNAQWIWSFPGFLDQYLAHLQVPTEGGARGSGMESFL